MLATEMMAAVGERSRMRSVSSSMPTRKMKRVTPIWASTPREGSISGRNTYDEISGATRPSREGPRRIPAITSPITGGWRSQPKRAPIARAVRITTTRARSTDANRSAPDPGARRGGAAPGAPGATSPAPSRSTSRKTAIVAPIISPHKSAVREGVGPALGGTVGVMAAGWPLRRPPRTVGSG